MDLEGTRPVLVTGDQRALVAGMCVSILELDGREPGFRLAARTRAAPTKRKIVGGSAKAPPLVIEATEAEAAAALALSPREPIVVLGPRSVVDLARVPAAGLVVQDARDTLVDGPAAPVAFYGLDTDAEPAVTPTWLAALAGVDPATGAQPFDLYAGGSFCGRFALPLPGADAVRSAVAAIAVCAEGLGVHIETARRALTSFRG